MAVPALSSGFEQIPGLASAQLEVAPCFPDPTHVLHIPGEQHSSSPRANPASSPPLTGSATALEVALIIFISFH